MTDKDITDILEKLNNQDKMLNRVLLSFSKLSSIDIVILLSDLMEEHLDIIEKLYREIEE